MDWTFALGLFVPAMGAIFVWTLNLARKDPPLFREVDKAVSAWIPRAAWVVTVSASFAFFAYPADRPPMLFTAALFLTALLYMRTSLPFFRRVSRLPSVRSSTEAPTAQPPMPDE